MTTRLLVIVLSFVGLSAAFRLGLLHPRVISAKASKTSGSVLRASWIDATTSLVAIGADYASEIEQATGTEIYGPIFKAGLFIFGSGFISAFIAGFIVNQSGSWEALESEFTQGKEAELSRMDKKDLETERKKIERNEEAVLESNMAASTGAAGSAAATETAPKAASTRTLVSSGASAGKSSSSSSYSDDDMDLGDIDV